MGFVGKTRSPDIFLWTHACIAMHRSVCLHFVVMELRSSPEGLVTLLSCVMVVRKLLILDKAWGSVSPQILSIHSYNSSLSLLLLCEGRQTNAKFFKNANFLILHERVQCITSNTGTFVFSWQVWSSRIALRRLPHGIQHP